MLFLVNFSFGGEESRNKKGYGGGGVHPMGWEDLSVEGILRVYLE